MLVVLSLLLLVASTFADENTVESADCSCNVNNTAVNPFLQNTSTTIVTELDDVGIVFYPTTGPPPVGGGAPGPVVRGFIFIPDACVKPKAYAPFLTHLNVDGHASVVVNTNGGEARTLSRILKIMEIYGNAFTYWAIGGHGEGGTWASRVARALHPKVKGLILVASLPDPAVDFTKLNIVVTVIYGTQDSVVTTSQVLASKATLPPSAYFQAISGASHSDFAFVHGSCVDPADTAVPSQNATYSILVAPTVPPPINSPSSLRISMTLLQIYETMPEALAYAGNTSYSTYVQTPTYFAFVPTQNVPRVGYIYHVGAAVAPEAYFPVLRQIADKGFLVVALRLPNHFGLLALNASGPVIDSFPAIPHWVIGGHSLGAVSASWDASILTPKVKGLILHDSGPRHNISTTSLRVLYAYGAAVGTGDRIPAGSLASLYFSRLPPYTAFYPIEGGNHYQFGWYGTQYPPAIASISRQVQTTTIVESAFQFLVQFSRLP